MKGQQMNEERFLKPQSLADMLGVSLQTIYRWSSENSIPKVKLRGSLRFRYSEIMNWLDKESRSKPTPVNRSII